MSSHWVLYLQQRDFGARVVACRHEHSLLSMPMTNSACNIVKPTPA